jgi:heme-degrading monooxygenase HmoA
MFVAMNRFQIIRGQENSFEQVWLSRDTHLGGVVPAEIYIRQYW